MMIRVRLYMNDWMEVWRVGGRDTCLWDQNKSQVFQVGLWRRRQMEGWSWNWKWKDKWVKRRNDWEEPPSFCRCAQKGVGILLGGSNPSTPTLLPPSLCLSSQDWQNHLALQCSLFQKVQKPAGSVLLSEAGRAWTEPETEVSRTLKHVWY